MSYETTQFHLPGNTIGQVIRPASSVITGFPRLPCFVGVGDRLARNYNYEITRAKVYDEALTFTGVGPYEAILTNQSDGDKNHTILVDADGTEVSKNHYTFETTVLANDTIQIPSQYYDATTTYSITYQSIDPDVQDAVPYDNLRQVVRCGRGVDSSEYTEYTDFFIENTITVPAADAGNTYVTGDTYGPTNGIKAKATIVGPVAPAQNITFTATADAPDGDEIVITAVAGVGLTVVENVAAKTVTITYVTGVSTTTLIVAAAAGLTLGTMTGAGAGFWVTPAQDQTRVTTSMDVTITNTSDSQICFDPTTSYSHSYDRTYSIACTTGGAVGAAVFTWTSIPSSLGNSVAARNPVHTSLDLSVTLGNEIDTAVSAVDVPLEYGISINFYDTVAVTNFVMGDTWTFTAYGPGKIEVDARHSNTNQFVTASSVAHVGTGTGTITLVSAVTRNYTGTHNRSWKVVCTAIGATYNFAYSSVGNDGLTSGTVVNIADGGTITLDLGVTGTINNGAIDFVVGDYYTFTIYAERELLTIKDDRNYTLECSAAVAGDVDFTYSTDTQEGGIGTLGFATAAPSATLPGNLVLWGRNIALPRHAASDEHTFSVTLDDYIRWDLQSEVTEVIAEEDIVHDVLGKITGTPNTYYIELNNIPTSVVSVQNSVPADVVYTIVLAGTDNTRFLAFAGDPADDLTVIYRHAGKEPACGETYRFSGLYLRDDDLYNTPILIQNEDDGEELLFPMSAGNHLAIVNSIAWDLSPVGFFICQAQDADDDGIYQDSDIETAIEGTEEEIRITDMCVLDAWGTLGKQLELIDELVNPILKAKRLLWLGAPINTAIGDTNTSGSLIYTAANTLVVYGDSQSHGTRILVGPTWVKRTIVFEDGTTQQVTLDGSFLAAAFCLQYASFDFPYQTALKKNITVFDEIQEYTKSENLQLGEHQINVLEEVGDSIYRWLTDWTVDRTGTEANAEAFKIISGLIQDRYVERSVDYNVEASIISLVPEDPEGGALAIRNVVAGVLRNLVATGYIGRYLTDAKTPRKLNPTTDIRVFRDTDRPTVHRYFFGYFRKYPIEYTYGYYEVDSTNFGLEAA